MGLGDKLATTAGTRASRGRDRMGVEQSRGGWVLAALVGTCVGASVVPALGAVYSTPGREAEVGTEGESVNAHYLALSNGGAAYANQGAATGTTGDSDGYAAASIDGCARSRLVASLSVTGCASGGQLAVSIFGPVEMTAFSNGNAFHGASGTGCVKTHRVALSGTGCTDSGVAASGTGDSWSRTDWSSGVPFVSAPGVAASGTGRASGGRMAVSGTGDSSADSTTITAVPAPAVAVSGTRNASTSGPGGVAVAPGGQASGGTAAVGSGDSSSYGGLVCVSAAGDCGGGAVTNVCPQGHCN